MPAADTTLSVSQVLVVTTGATTFSAPWSLQVDVVGITKDLPGGLGGAGGSASAAGGGGDDCIITQAGAPGWTMTAMRSWRDLALESFFGRLLTALYYAPDFCKSGNRKPQTPNPNRRVV